MTQVILETFSTPSHSLLCVCEIFFREMFRHIFDNEETTGTSNKAVEFLLSCFQPCCFGANNDALNRLDFGAKNANG